ncbi:hypothetical protein U1P98_12820 [Lysinibacillus irui]|uniref:Uncharacterized protein n=1 Tax=Lysinibacillus irui TaxID=2998077 RepID=A0ABU5NMB0_9BACI|nr:hypothetical protein [Lysinibacillus irui]MEA0555600.1 hypothetical protein [Lysinibacillus irui]MEA0977185.1 hypothetical protein [Lysinibacillus irui]MEA1043339.1 hypothetical protein [Lysinibacillus irui]
MAALPIPANQYFNDFSFDLIEYEVKRKNVIVGNFKGLLNKDENGRHIAFLMDASILPGDVLTASHQSFVIRSIEHDHYNGTPELLKAYY